MVFCWVEKFKISITVLANIAVVQDVFGIWVHFIVIDVNIVYEESQDLWWIRVSFIKFRRNNFNFINSKKFFSVYSWSWNLNLILRSYFYLFFYRMSRKNILHKQFRCQLFGIIIPSNKLWSIKRIKLIHVLSFRLNIICFLDLPFKNCDKLINLVIVQRIMVDKPSSG